MEFIGRSFVVTLFIINILDVSTKTTVDQNKQNVDDETIQLHVITKREAVNDIQKDYPHVEGRTFRASEPLDPNSTHTIHGDPPQSVFQTFETVNEIFQPEVDSESTGDFEEAHSEVAVEQPIGRTDVNDTYTKEKTKTKYGAQYPYSETSGHAYSGSLPHSGTQTHRTDDGYQQSVTSRRVVLAGRGPDTSGHSGSNQYETRRTIHQPSQMSRPGYPTYTQDFPISSQSGTTYPGARQVSTERRVYSGYNSGNSRENSYQNSRTEVRGPYYGGQVYVDSNGHYVDAQGRHLDSTGRYYDISGRYQDAVMTGTQTYTHTGSRTPVYNSRPSSGYYDNHRFTSGTSSSGGFYDSDGRYIGSNPGGSISYDSTNQGGGYTDGSQSRPIDSYGGTQFYSSGRSYQTTYDPIVSQISSDPVYFESMTEERNCHLRHLNPGTSSHKTWFRDGNVVFIIVYSTEPFVGQNCPVTNTRVTINGLTCNNAVAQLGPYVCYNYERVSTECCERCLQVKRPENVGCEYGDRSHQCRDIQPFDCYSERNRQICCERCRQFREQRSQNSQAGCEYGDLTPRCQSMIERPHLCYLPDNQRVCCHSCPRLANTQEPNCQWGNQSPELCEPFDENRRLKLNCYMQAVQEICCSTCRSLRERMRETIPGCEYGDSPVLFYSGREAMDCPEYIRQYGLDNCNDPEVSQKCCYTCYRYRIARG